MGAEILEALETLGLTQYEAKAYYALVTVGFSAASEISKLSGIPHSKTYEVLSRLEAKGLVESREGRPKKYRALAPDTAINILKDDIEATLKEDFFAKKAMLENNYQHKLIEISSAGKKASELTNLFEKSAMLTSSEDIVWTMTGAEQVVNQLRRIINNAENEVRLMLPKDDFSPIEKDILAILAKGVKVRLIVHRLTNSVHKVLKGAEVFREEVTPTTGCGIVLVDGMTAMFISEDYKTGFKSSSKSVVTMLSHFYQHEREESTRI